MIQWTGHVCKQEGIFFYCKIVNVTPCCITTAAFGKTVKDLTVVFTSTVIVPELTTTSVDASGKVPQLQLAALLQLPDVLIHAFTKRNR